jgi:hypothetical protein
LDHEIAAAIESLQSSTAAIEAQSRVLEAQKDALTKLRSLEKPNLDLEHARNERRRKEGQEKARLDVAVSGQRHPWIPMADMDRLTMLLQSSRNS